MPTTVTCPAAPVFVTAPAAHRAGVTVVPTSPTGDFRVPSVRPTFAVTVSRTDSSIAAATIEVQVDSLAGDFTTPLLDLTRDVSLTFTPTPVTLPATADLPVDDATTATHYQWRVRAVVADVPLDWATFPSGVQNTFYTSAGSIAGLTTSIAWTVDPGHSLTPHIWFAYPAAGEPGSSAAIVGQGFGTSTGTVTVNGVPATVTSWTTVAAAGEPEATDATNDDIADATVITSLPFTSELVSNAGCGVETGEDPGTTGYRTVWWTFTPTEDVHVDIDTHQSTGTADPDTILMVYETTGPPNDELARNDDNGAGGFWSQISDLALVADTQYFISVGAYNDETLNYVLAIAEHGTGTGGGPGAVDPLIDAASGTATCEHCLVVFTIPDAGAGVIKLETA